MSNIGEFPWNGILKDHRQVQIPGFKWTNNCRRVYTFSMKDKTLVNEISRRSRAIGSPLGRVSRTPSLHISGSGSGCRKHKKISRSRSTLEKNFESTPGHVYPLKSLFTCYDVCHVYKARSAWHIYFVVSKKWLKLCCAGDDNRQASLSLLALA